MGFASALSEDGSLEMDNIVRGVKSGDSGIMARGMNTLIDWAEEKLGPREIYLRVFEDNKHAIAFYEKLGFVHDKLLPLTKHMDGANVNYKPTVPGAKADTHFVRMTYRPHRVCKGDKMVLTAGPSISAREASYALDAARYGWNDQWNKYLRRFEQGFAEYIGVKHALAFSSCTGALHLSLLALGIGKGDEVIVPELTWVATANAVLYTGATPIFADVEEDLPWCLDPDSFASKITPRTEGGHAGASVRAAGRAWIGSWPWRRSTTCLSSRTPHRRRERNFRGNGLARSGISAASASRGRSCSSRAKGACC